MNRVPIVATIVVVLAMALMIALGVWQLDRRHQKEALLRRYTANETLPPIAYPAGGTGDDLLFRRTTATCAPPLSWTREAGRDRSGQMGWRQVAACRDGVAVQIGIARDPNWTPRWTGGEVTGFLTHAPDHRPIIAAAFDHEPQRLMIVADTPAQGLSANAGPDLSNIPNNHLAYAVQWFVFAGLAGIIYAIALGRRMRGAR